MWSGGGAANPRTNSLRTQREPARPCEAPVGCTPSPVPRRGGAGGVQRGRPRCGTMLDAPSGPLCFFLRVEKEEVAGKPSAGKHSFPCCAVQYPAFSLTRCAGAPSRREPMCTLMLLVCTACRGLLPSSAEADATYPQPQSARPPLTGYRLFRLTRSSRFRLRRTAHWADTRIAPLPEGASVHRHAAGWCCLQKVGA